jgi:hypothetical protein
MAVNHYNHRKVHKEPSLFQLSVYQKISKVFRNNLRCFDGKLNKILQMRAVFAGFLLSIVYNVIIALMWLKKPSLFSFRADSYSF